MQRDEKTTSRPRPGPSIPFGLFFFPLFVLFLFHFLLLFLLFAKKKEPAPRAALEMGPKEGRRRRDTGLMGVLGKREEEKGYYTIHPRRGKEEKKPPRNAIVHLGTEELGKKNASVPFLFPFFSAFSPDTKKGRPFALQASLVLTQATPF